MSGRIKAEDIVYVREHAHIDEVVTAAGVALKNAGGGQKKGLCPFHDEKSPSFHVTPSKNYYHCFGCGVGGDVIDFIMKTDHLSFTETIERLASQIGYTLRYEEGGPQQPTSKRSRLYSAHLEAAKFYRELLNTSPDAGYARDLLTKRGFDKRACDTFGVGYAPNGWDLLTKHLRATGYSIEELEEAGLSKMGERGPIDKFRNRIMWPIKDISGEIVGFGARKLASDEEDQGPKYLNTSETPIYKKSQVLYGLDMAKKDIAKNRQVVVVEGYTDVMACHLAGITTAVATCGTAFGDDHIRIIRRLLMDADTFRGEVIFTFDGDAAGQKAAMKAFGDDQKFVTQTFVAVEPDGLDPSDLRQEKGDLALRDLIAKRVPLFEFAIRTELKKYNLETAEGRVNALNTAAPLVAAIRDKSLRPEYIKLLSGWLGTEVEVVTGAVNTALKKVSQAAPVVAPADDATDSTDADRAWHPNPTEPTLMLEREVLKAKLQMPALVIDWKAIEEGAFTHPAYRELRRVIDSFGVEPVLLESVTDERMRQLFTELSVEPVRTDGAVSERYVSSIIARLREVLVSRKIAELKSSLQRLNPLENEVQYNESFAELVSLENQKRGLHELSIGSL
jgi:DNA primase